MENASASPAPAESAPQGPPAPTIESLQELRDSQTALFNSVEARVRTEFPVDERTSSDADQAVLAGQIEARMQFDGMADRYAQGFVHPHEEPDKYWAILDLARSVSVNHMDDDTWRLGEADDSGKRSSPDETSGMAIAQKAIDKINYVPNTWEKRGITDPEIHRAEGELEDTRDHLAKLSIQVRQLKGKQSLSESEQALMDEYRTTRTTYRDARAYQSLVWLMRHERTGVDGKILTRELGDMVMEELEEFTRAEISITDNPEADKSTKKTRADVTETYYKYKDSLRETLRSDQAMRMTPLEFVMYANQCLDSIFNKHAEINPDSRKNRLARFGGSLSLSRR